MVTSLFDGARGAIRGEEKSFLEFSEICHNSAELQLWTHLQFDVHFPLQRAYPALSNPVACSINAQARFQLNNSSAESTNSASVAESPRASLKSCFLGDAAMPSRTPTARAFPGQLEPPPPLESTLHLLSATFYSFEWPR